ncbi:MAG: VOC family protein [Gaiellaceae bacterium]
MRPGTLDHLALWTDRRDELAAFLTRSIGLPEIDRTETWTRLGADGRRRIALSDAEGPREPGPLVHVALRVAALAGRPASVEAPGGLRVVLLERAEAEEFELDHVALRPTPPPERPLLDHIGVRVEHGPPSAFVTGPDGILIEYVC